MQYIDLNTLELFLNEMSFVSDPSNNCFGDKFFNLRIHFVNINTGYSGLVYPQMCTELNSTLYLYYLAEWKEHPKSVSFPIPRQHTRLHILNSSSHQPTLADYSLLWRVLRSPTRAPGRANNARIYFFTGSSVQSVGVRRSADQILITQNLRPFLKIKDEE